MKVVFKYWINGEARSSEVELTEEEAGLLAKSTHAVFPHFINGNSHFKIRGNIASTTFHALPQGRVFMVEIGEAKDLV